MRLISNHLVAILATGITLSAFSARLPARQANALEASTFFPGAPGPRLAQADSSSQQVSGGHSHESQPSSSVDLQRAPGGVSGTVSDAYGDVIPGALVTLGSLCISGSFRRAETESHLNAVWVRSNGLKLMFLLHGARFERCVDTLRRGHGQSLVVLVEVDQRKVRQQPLVVLL